MKSGLNLSARGEGLDANMEGNQIVPSFASGMGMASV